MKPQLFNRDMSWLSFNHRVLQEAKDHTLPLYERIKFLAIYANNLEEFYKVRVAEHRSILTIDSKGKATKTVQKAEDTLSQIHKEVTLQQQEFTDIFTNMIMPELSKNNIFLCKPDQLKASQIEYIKQYFNNEILPFLQPIMVKEGEIYAFLRDNRLYITVRMYKKKDTEQLRPKYAAIKMPHSKVTRFIQLPVVNDRHYILFLEDIIKVNLDIIFPGYTIDSAHVVQVSRDADLMIENELDGDLVNKISRSLSRRKTGAPSRFAHERGMPQDMIKVICHAFNINKTDVVEGGNNLALQHLFALPNPLSPQLEAPRNHTIPVSGVTQKTSIFKSIKKNDILVQYPYHSYDHLIRFLMEASLDSSVDEIMVTQYRVASHSVVVNSLISAAKNGKKVTVFVELKARFDEENNLISAARMKKAGVKIIYSIPNLKVHAKVALISRRSKDGNEKTSYAYLSTGNFNEETASIYSDFGLFTVNKEIIKDLRQLFHFLNDTNYRPEFSKILVAQFNLVDSLAELLDKEIEAAKAGRKANITIKMNAIQDPTMIAKLYEASEAGVTIDMIIRGICCLIPGESYSRNITITRLVDHYLEHTRIWHFHADGENKIYMGSPDWMKRNLYRRVETAFPILDESIKTTIMHYLQLELKDNTKGTFINNKLEDIPKRNDEAIVRSQFDMIEYWKEKE